MKLLEFLDSLADLELSQVNFSNKDEFGRLVKQNALISLINRGVRELHTKFIIKRGELRINVENVNSYRVDIRDKAKVLTPDLDGEIIKVIQVFDECGNDVDFNTIDRRQDCLGNTIEQYDKTTLIFRRCCGCYTIYYQLGAKTIDKDKVYESTEIDLPVEFKTALIYYIAANIHAINPMTNEYAVSLSPSIVYARKYKEELMELYNLNLEVSFTGNKNQRFRDSDFI